MKKILTLIILSTLFVPLSFGEDINCATKNPPSKKEVQEFHKMLDSRLNLTLEQKEIINKNRELHRKKMKQIVNRMDNLKDRIKNIYLNETSPLVAELKIAPMKAELALLKQNADNLKKEYRKNFENILTQEQKIEFEKIRKELRLKKQMQN